MITTLLAAYRKTASLLPWLWKHEVTKFIFSTRTWKGEPPCELEVHLLGKQGWSNTSRNQHFFNTLEKELPKYQLSSKTRSTPS
jgi:hypothetical protein